VVDGSADPDGHVAAGVEFDRGAAQDLAEPARDDRRAAGLGGTIEHMF
jgi:hypothetical protein